MLDFYQFKLFSTHFWFDWANSQQILQMTFEANSLAVLYRHTNNSNALRHKTGEVQTDDLQLTYDMCFLLSMMMLRFKMIVKCEVKQLYVLILKAQKDLPQLGESKLSDVSCPSRHRPYYALTCLVDRGFGQGSRISFAWCASRTTGWSCGFGG